MSLDLQYIPWHVHTVYSPLDGCLELDDYIKWAKENELSALSITDHGTLAGVYNFTIACEKAGINPIVGGEFYTENDDGHKNGHLILVAKNDLGYRRIVELNNRAARENFRYKPRLKLEWLLEKRIDDIIISTACIKGMVANLVLRGELERAEKRVVDFFNLYGGDFYLELQFNEMADQHKANELCLQMAKKYGIRLIFGCDTHYAQADGVEVQDRLFKIQRLATKKDTIEEDVDALKFTARRLYLKKTEDLFREAREWNYKIEMRELVEAVRSTHEVAAKCSYRVKSGIKYPPIHLDADIKTCFYKICHQSLDEKYSLGILDEKKRPEYLQRIDYEFKALLKTEYINLLFIMREIIQDAKQSHVMPGPGRGSAAGSFSCYLFGITYVDPIEHDLLFERFCNEERTSSPDVDVDFSDRGTVLEIIRRKYGLDNVLSVANFSYFKPKSALRDLMRVEKIPIPEINYVTKFWEDKQSTVDNLLQPVMREAAAKWPSVFNNFRHILKKIRHVGTHASAVIVVPDNEIIPITKRKNTFCTQENGKTLDARGFLKLDILGLTNLSIIDHAIKISGAQIDIYNMDLTDKKVFEEYRKGYLTGIFQCENPETEKLCQRVPIESFNDLINIVSVIRPNLDKEGYIYNRNNPQNIQYLTGLEDIFKSTYGILLYQEQVMRICQYMAGFSLNEADEIRRIIAKKTGKLKDYKEQFLTRAVERRHAPEYALKIWDKIEGCQDYIFNKSHGCVYAYIGYICMWLKVYHPAAFLAACLRYDDDKDAIKKYIQEANRLGVKVEFPNVCKSQPKTDLIDGRIYIGLSACKGVEGAAELIIRARPFQSLKDFVNRADLRRVNSSVLEILAKVGAFSDFNTNRKQVFYQLKKLVRERQGKVKFLGSSRQQMLFPLESEEANSLKAFDIERLADYDPRESRTDEMTYLGFSQISHQIQFFRKAIDSLDEGISTIAGIEGGYFKIVMQIIDVAIKKTKKGKDFAIVTGEDETDRIKVFIWAEDVIKYGHLLKPGEIIFVKLSRKVDFPTPQVISDYLLDNPEEKKIENFGDFLRQRAGCAKK